MFINLHTIVFKNCARLYVHLALRNVNKYDFYPPARRIRKPRGLCYGNVAGWVTGWLGGCLSHAGIVSKRLNLS